MAIYQKKYTLEFDDIIEGEFNDYKLEIWKKYSTNTSDNVYVSAYNDSGENISKGDPVYIISGVVYRAKASSSSTMPSIGVAYEDIPQSQAGNILTKGVLPHTYTGTTGINFYVAQNGGATSSTLGLTIVQLIGYQNNYNEFVLLDSDEVTLKGNGSPIQLNYNVTQDDILSPFRTSYLDISFYKESLSDDFSELFLSEMDSFKVYLFKNTNLFWRGWIGSELITEPFASPPYVIKLRAYDGLHLLKEKSYFDTEEIFQATSNQYNDRFGYHYLTDVVEKCIYNTGVIGESTYDDAIVFYNTRIKNENAASNEYQEFFSNTKIHHQTFLNGESDGMNMEEVLKMILNSSGSIIYQRDGNWCIIKPSDFTVMDSPIPIKRDTWRADTNPSAINYITTNEVVTGNAISNISSEVNYFQVDNSATMTLQYPLKEVIIEQEFDHNMLTKTTIDAVKDLGSSDPSGTFLFTDWEASGATEAVVLRSQDTQSQPKNINKSFIEVDLGTGSQELNFTDDALYYPTVHDCTMDSSWITGLRANAKIRPLGRSLVEKELSAVLFSPRLTNNLSPSNKYGFGIKGSTRNFNLTASLPTDDPPRTEMNDEGGLLIKTDDFGSGLTRTDLTVTPRNPTASYVIKVDTPTGNWYTSASVTGTTLVRKNEFFSDGSGYLTPNRYTVTIVTTAASIGSVQWNIEGNISGGGTWADTWYGDTKVPNEGTLEVAANNFYKKYDHDDGDYNSARIVTKKINDWQDCQITATENWQNNIPNLDVKMFIFGAAKFVTESGVHETFPYTNTNDVSYTNVKLVPIVTTSKFVPTDQEYKLSQNANYASKKNKKVEIGSSVFNVGANRFIGFDSSNNVKKSWYNWQSDRLSGVTTQHLVGECYMEFYRISVRRIDTTHYGNYKYGDRLVLNTNGSPDTLNGSKGKFYPMNVTMDLKMARTKFTGDDLLDNSSGKMPTLTKTIKWIGENDIAEVETLT